MEIWKPLKDFPNYNVSSEGQIMNVKTQYILKPFVNEKGYEKVCLRKNNRQYTVSVHKIVAETFLGEHAGMDVRHKNSDRSKNCVDNLEWVTRQETIKSAYERGTKKARKYTRIKVIETNDIFDSITECARVIGCDPSSISKCLSGLISHVKGYHFETI